MNIFTHLNLAQMFNSLIILQAWVSHDLKMSCNHMAPTTKQCNDAP